MKDVSAGQTIRRFQIGWSDHLPLQNQAFDIRRVLGKRVDDRIGKGRRGGGPVAAAQMIWSELCGDRHDMAPGGASVGSVSEGIVMSRCGRGDQLPYFDASNARSR